VPGDAVAASSDGGSVLVLLADGRLLRSTASGWVVLQQIGAGADVMVRLRAMTGFRLSKGNAPGAIVQKGDEFEVSPARAIELTAMGLAEGVLA
jgi:hypothetical protein